MFTSSFDTISSRQFNVFVIAYCGDTFIYIPLSIYLYPLANLTFCYSPYTILMLRDLGSFQEPALLFPVVETLCSFLPVQQLAAVLMTLAYHF